jgi:hypothetical protein
MHARCFAAAQQQCRSSCCLCQLILPQLSQTLTSQNIVPHVLCACPLAAHQAEAASKAEARAAKEAEAAAKQAEKEARAAAKAAEAEEKAHAKAEADEVRANCCCCCCCCCCCSARQNELARAKE